jgi:hypothetical protein
LINTNVWKESIDLQLRTLKILQLPLTENGEMLVLNAFESDERKRITRAFCAQKNWMSAERAPYIKRFNEVFNLRKRINGTLVPDVLNQRRALTAEYVNFNRDELGANLYPSSGFIGKFLDVTHHTEAPIGFHFWTAVTTLGCLLRRNVLFDRKNFELFPNQYLFLIGPTASRKSHTMKNCQRFLRAMNQEIYHIQAQEGGGVDEANAELDHALRIMPNQITPPDLLKSMSYRTYQDGEDGTWWQQESIGLLMNDEVSSLLGKDVAMSDDMISNLTTLYDCQDFYERSSLTRGTFTLRNIVLTAFFGSTIDWINTNVTPAMFTGGFIGRSIFVNRNYTDKDIPTPPSLDPIAFQRLVARSIPWAMTQHQLICTMEEYSQPGMFFDKWYRENNRRIKHEINDKKLSAYLQRKQNHLLRLAMILQVSEAMLSLTPEELAPEDFFEIDKRFVEQALAILDFEEQYIIECFESIGEDTSENALLTTFRHLIELCFKASKGKRFEKIQINRRCASKRGLATRARWQPYFNELLDLNEIEEIKVGRKTFIQRPE